MANIKKYISDGNLEAHCFDIFNKKRGRQIADLSSIHPEIRQELQSIEQTIEQLTRLLAIKPPPELKNRILDVLGFSEEEYINLDNLPPTGKHSKYTSWLNAVEHLLPEEPFEDFFAEVLRQDTRIAQTLVVTRMDVPEEVHEEIAESFFILKGRCSCTVGDKVFILNPGDYLDIPLHINHDIRILSPYVIAILQHQFA